ncbi:hypothetical protein [Neisseria iguanae]|uniref:hypothetical protein n=1 Tax=Neisseria iguanae TaxID=90242 RepID=UPI0011B27BFC|nr:hypothetical protein [Neisseria iguanae]
MKNIALSTFFSLSLSACSGCFSPMPVIPCTIGERSHVDSFIKNISNEQRMVDIKYCLGTDASGIPDKYGRIFNLIRDKYSNPTEGHEREKRFTRCMIEEKGYKYLG